MKRAAIGVLAVGLASGCALGPNYRRPPVTVPEQFYGQNGAGDAHSLADVPWWQLYQDPVLSELIATALRDGFDARLAAARVEETRALYGVARGNLLPAFGYTGGWERTRVDQVDIPAQPVETKWTAEVGGTWELDLWGKIRRQNEAARAQYLASEEARRGVLLSLVAEIATAYFELRELDAELEIARRTTAAFQDTFDLFNRALEGGAASALQTSRAEAALGQVAAQIPEIQRAIVAKENQINLLLGRNPQTIPREGPLTPVPPDVPAGLPSALLERRPDVRQAEQFLVAANAGIGVAKANFLPTLSLTGLFGNVSPELGKLLSKGNTWDATADLLGPAFQGASLKHNYRAAQARFLEAKVQYEAAVASAFGDVSTALANRTRLVETEEQRTRAVRAYREAVRLASLRYRSGLSAYFEVLDAQQQLYPAEISLAQTRRDRLVAVVALYKALGGGWQAETSAAAQPAARESR